jgi:hypothetical protein
MGLPPGFTVRPKNEKKGTVRLTLWITVPFSGTGRFLVLVIRRLARNFETVVKNEQRDET